jgi:hypothetical protein
MVTAAKYVFFKLQRCVRVCLSRQVYTISNNFITTEWSPALPFTQFINPILWVQRYFPTSASFTA